MQTANFLQTHFLLKVNQKTGTVVAKSSMNSFPATAKEAHLNCTHAFPKTRSSILTKTATMCVAAARGRRQGMVLTAGATTPLRHRRYSVDVVTEGWSAKEAVGWSNNDGNLPKVEVPMATASGAQEAEPLMRQAPALDLPDPRRFYDLSKYLIDPQPGDDTICLELEQSTLTNEEFNLICSATDDAWWRDNILNTALELIGRERRAGSRGIKIINSMISSILYQVGLYGDTDGDSFKQYAGYKKQLAGNRWIFLPINDGFVSLDFGETAGTHWAFILVDTHRRTARYIDSFDPSNSTMHQVAHHVVGGLEYLLEGNYERIIEWDTPHQWKQNRVNLGQDFGPCGPFVVCMISYLVKKIVKYQEAGSANHIVLDMGVGWTKSWRFDSHRVRQETKAIIAHECHQRHVMRLYKAHEEAASKPASEEIEELEVFEWPRRGLEYLAEELEFPTRKERTAEVARETEFDTELALDTEIGSKVDNDRFFGEIFGESDVDMTNTKEGVEEPVADVVLSPEIPQNKTESETVEESELLNLKGKPVRVRWGRQWT
ncbi:hypothetical protein CC78DRAFT_546427 [Lojkania enalia]|uniref:Ubiquitin-like protease family profile domain-containing protein n=1 Tax=Lojkania enalia TaxID=147567 RepID=A0A9P4K5L5_9PLEO|nr:hypothetical protein CC78DRAFT_546427 [Didymosphaeria enalia]